MTTTSSPSSASNTKYQCFKKEQDENELLIAIHLLVALYTSSKRVRKRFERRKISSQPHTIEATIGATIVLFREGWEGRGSGRRTGTRVLTQLVALAVASTPAALTRHTDEEDRACAATQHNRIKCHVAQRRTRWLNQPVRYCSPPLVFPRAQQRHTFPFRSFHFSTTSTNQGRKTKLH